MAEEDQHLDENGNPTLDETRESKEAEENLIKLFEVPEDEEEQEEDAPVTRAEYNRLLKGVQKLATVTGREKVQPTEKKVENEETTVGVISPVIKNLYFKSNPEAKLVWTEVEKEAALLKKDPFELYESSSYLRGEAKAKAEANRIDEENKIKVHKPNNGVSLSKNEFANVKSDADVEGMTSAQRAAFMKEQVAKGN